MFKALKECLSPRRFDQRWKRYASLSKVISPKVVIIAVSLIGSVAYSQQVTNPVLAGFYPDPSICRAGDDYYLVNSSFAYYPGLPLFHSRDLLNWKQVGFALNRPSQLDLDNAGVSRGLFAPAISYHDGTFYIVCTLVDQLGNFVVTAKDPKKKWSEPVALPAVNGIDPSLFFDDDGKAYVVYNSIPPDNKPLYEGHRTIRILEFDPVKLATVGEEKVLVNGGTDISKKPVWIEAPHIYKKDGFYYLLCAEGGTAYNHSEVAFRSSSINGPFESFNGNPILTQRQLDLARRDPITSTGHADLVQTKKGDWYAVFLGCRPYEGDYYNTGRETFLAPVQWKDGWPVINPNHDEVQYAYPVHAIRDKSTGFGGNYTFRDEFNNRLINDRYQFLRTVRKPWFSLEEKPGWLSLQLQPNTCQQKGNPSFIGFRQPHLKGYASTEMRFVSATEKEQAGLMVFQNEGHYYFLSQSMRAGRQQVQLYRGPGNGKPEQQPELIASADLLSQPGQSLFLKIEANNGVYNFYYALAKGKWIVLKKDVDGKFLSSKEAGGFVGCLYALYATSNGEAPGNKALFNWFECRNDDDVYKHQQSK